MNYDITENELQKKLKNLQQSNTQLRDELAVVLNENYMYASKQAAATEERNAKLSQQGWLSATEDRVAELERQLQEYSRELEFIKNSNFYKIWMKYRFFPEPFRHLVRVLFTPIKKIYQGMKKVFS